MSETLLGVGDPVTVRAVPADPVMICLRPHAYVVDVVPRDGQVVYYVGHSELPQLEYGPFSRDRERIKACGYEPVVVTADGAAGWPAGQPYDRVVATVAFPRIPRAWVDQTTEGGIIVASLWRNLGGGPLVQLAVIGGEAQGSFLAQFGGFMPTRSVTATPEALSEALGQTGTTRRARLSGEVLRHPDAGLWIALLVEDATWLGFTPEGGRDQLWVFTPDGSWAMIENATMTVEQHGPRRLWEEVEAADQRWVDAGKPTRDRMGLTVTKSGLHQFWLDEPDNVQWDDDQK